MTLEHANALARLDALLRANPDIEPGSREGDELDALIEQIMTIEEEIK